MPKFSDLPTKVQLLIVVGVALGLTAAFYFLVLKSMGEANTAAQKALEAKVAENKKLRTYESRLAELNSQIASLQAQLERQKQIVPDEKEAPQFMHMMQDTAANAGIEIRRYTARPPSTKEYYTEVPFDVELDGPYYSLLNFFERVAKLERIINISGLQVATIKRPTDAKVKKAYQYAPGESVVASAVATTFFSHEPTAQAPPKAPPAAGKK